MFLLLSENNRLATPQTAAATVAPGSVATTAGSLAQQHHAARQISGTPPTGGSPSASSLVVNSPKTASKLRNNGLVNVTGNNNINSRLRSKESSPDPINGGAVVNNNGAGISLEKRIRDSIVLLTQNKYSVLDDGQQREAAAKLARLANMETELRVQSQGVQALGVLVNYMVHDVSIRSAFLLIFI